MKKQLKTKLESSYLMMVVLVTLSMIGMLVLSACGTKAEPPAEPAAETEDVLVEDAPSEDTSSEDTSAMDTSAEDASTIVSEDAVSEDKAEPEAEQSKDTVDVSKLYDGYYEGYTYGTAPLASVIFLLNEMDQVDSEYYAKTEEISDLTRELNDCTYAPDEAIVKMDEIMFKDMGGAENVDDEARDFCVMILIAGSGLFDSEDETVFNQQAMDFLAGNFLPNHEDYKPVEGMTAPTVED